MITDEPRGDDRRLARDDLLAWIGGGLVWGLVMLAAQGVPDGVAFGAAVALILRRACGLILGD